jgi:hypothetical protein
MKQTEPPTTLTELVRRQRCRTGHSTAITRLGAYWLADPNAQIGGSDPNDPNTADTDYNVHLQLRHYRGGEVEARVILEGWNEEHGTYIESYPLNIDAVTTTECLIVALLRSPECSQLYNQDYILNLQRELLNIGLPVAPPPPDDDPNQTKLPLPDVEKYIL